MPLGCRMADLGMNIVTVIHQPRYSVFSLFHEVLLLGKAGRTVFQGLSRCALGFRVRMPQHGCPCCLPLVPHQLSLYLDCHSWRQTRRSCPSNASAMDACAVSPPLCWAHPLHYTAEATSTNKNCMCAAAPRCRTSSRSALSCRPTRTRPTSSWTSSPAACPARPTPTSPPRSAAQPSMSHPSHSQDNRMRDLLPGRRALYPDDGQLCTCGEGRCGVAREMSACRFVPTGHLRPSCTAKCIILGLLNLEG